MRETLLIYLMRIPAILFAISVHESAHAWVAYKLGDPTAKMPEEYPSIRSDT